ncbi:uncharacterized protein EV422DRAFT_114041 [Fimicolochytrium jonesii]|uniref:uncharacterized protein n=1 Tax=Fimicolochytrium jonesii TaxID=1396493 RepID=UPI0022FDF276|nr:uncharacterized protein EV422DRAFT_114041 [Fimicolochytrium jonesii]KAI8819467.1 hypothetical protein EV422DRAFT_114041 [Fimicolochytrium jonesii]
MVAHASQLDRSPYGVGVSASLECVIGGFLFSIILRTPPQKSTLYVVSPPLRKSGSNPSSRFHNPTLYSVKRKYHTRAHRSRKATMNGSEEQKLKHDKPVCGAEVLVIDNRVLLKDLTKERRRADGQNTKGVRYWYYATWAKAGKRSPTC